MNPNSGRASGIAYHFRIWARECLTANTATIPTYRRSVGLFRTSHDWNSSDESIRTPVVPDKYALRMSPMRPQADEVATKSVGVPCCPARNRSAAGAQGWMRNFEMEWHVWIRNSYCGTMDAASHQDAVRVVEEKWGTTVNVDIYRAEVWPGFSPARLPERRSPV